MTSRQLRHSGERAGLFVKFHRRAATVRWAILTTWPAGQEQPGVSTLNALDWIGHGQRRHRACGHWRRHRCFRQQRLGRGHRHQRVLRRQRRRAGSRCIPQRLVACWTHATYQGSVSAAQLRSMWRARVRRSQQPRQAFVLNATVVPHGSLGYLTCGLTAGRSPPSPPSMPSMARLPRTWQSCPEQRLD